MNGFHQLMAFFNNSNWRTDLPYGHSGWGPTGHRLRAYAKGGRPSKGETVLVGENGPELFEADTAGTVHPHEKLKRSLIKDLHLLILVLILLSMLGIILINLLLVILKRL